MRIKVRGATYFSSQNLKMMSMGSIKSGSKPTHFRLKNKAKIWYLLITQSSIIVENLRHTQILNMLLQLIGKLFGVNTCNN